MRKFCSKSIISDVNKMGKMSPAQGLPDFDKISKKLSRDILYKPRMKPESLVPVPPKEIYDAPTTAPVKYDLNHVCKSRWFKSLRRETRSTKGKSSLELSIPSDDPREWNRLLNTCKAQRNFLEMRVVVQNMKASNIPFSTYTYSAALSGYAGLLNQLRISQSNTSRAMIVGDKEEIFQEAKQLYQESIDSGFTHDLFVASAMISVCAKGLYAQEALDVFEPFRQGLTVVPPDIQLYTGVIEACFRGGLAKDAFRLFEEAKIKFNLVDPRLLATVVRGCLKEGQSRRAYEYFNEMLVSGYLPSTYHFNVLLEAASISEEDFYIAFDFFEKMKEIDCPTDNHTYLALFRACEKFGKFDKATQVLDHIGKSLSNLVMEGYFKVVLSSLHEEKIVLNPQTVLTRQDRGLLVWNMLSERCRNSNHCPGYLLDIVCRILIRSELYDEIPELLSFFTKFQIEPTDNTWKALSLADDIERLSDVLKKSKMSVTMSKNEFASMKARLQTIRDEGQRSKRMKALEGIYLSLFSNESD